MSRTKSQATVYLTSEQVEGVKALAAETGNNQSDFYRLGFDLVIELARGLEFPAPVYVRKRFELMRDVFRKSPEGVG